MIATYVQDVKGNCTMAGENLFLEKITLSNLDELQLISLLRCYFETFSQANKFNKEEEYFRYLWNNEYQRRF